MLLNKSILNYIQLLFLVLILVSCSDKTNKVPVINYQDKTQLLDVVKKYYNSDISVAFGGVFDQSGRETIVVGREVENSEDWGIKFTQLQLIGNEFKVKYETDLLDGSFKQAFVDKIKFSSFENELIYYNSQDYYLGSGGGEIFSYIVDFDARQVYYAHLVIDPSSSVSLFISDNTENKEIKNFFLLNFRKDYPGLKLVDEDIIIE